jgi:hypothetical protein
MTQTEIHITLERDCNEHVFEGLERIRIAFGLDSLESALSLTVGWALGAGILHDVVSAGLLGRERRRDDIEVQVRFRMSAFQALRGIGLPVHGTMSLVEDDDAYAVVVWSGEMPDWPDPVPGNEAARAEKAERG